MMFQALGDGSGDDTAAVQAAIDATISGGRLDGLGRAYRVGSLAIPPNISMEHFRLITIPGSTQFVSPITIDGRTTAKGNIKLYNVHVDGNRANQTGMNAQPAEDGGRHGFRVLGKVADSILDSCSAHDCGSDGIELFSDSAVPATDDPAGLCFQRITLINCDFYRNRRHGGSSDSTHDLKFINCKFWDNGLDVGPSEGEHGALTGLTTGILYGQGWDFEGYSVGCGIDGVTLMDCRSEGNAAYALQFTEGSSTDRSAAGFRTRRNIKIIGGYYELGVHALPGDLHAIQFVAADQAGDPACYSGVTIVGATTKGRIYTRNCDGVSIASPVVLANGADAIWASLVKTKRHSIVDESSVPSSLSIYYDATTSDTRKAMMAVDGAVPSATIIGDVSGGPLASGGAVDPNTDPVSPGLILGSNGGTQRTYDIALSKALQDAFPGAFSIGLRRTDTSAIIEIRGGQNKTGDSGSNVSGAVVQRGTAASGFEDLARFGDIQELLHGIKMIGTSRDYTITEGEFAGHALAIRDLTADNWLLVFDVLDGYQWKFAQRARFYADVLMNGGDIKYPGHTTDSPVKISGTALVFDKIKLDDDTHDVTGTLQIGHGGTSATTEAGARANLSVYSKGEVDTLIAALGISNYYTKAEVNTLLAGKIGAHSHAVTGTADLVTGAVTGSTDIATP